MKTVITIILFCAFITPCFSQQNLRLALPDEITYKGDMAYFHDSPFTGLLVDKKTNKQLGEFKNGYKNGAFIEYYPNGKKKSEANYSNGILNGKYKKWFLNGQNKSSYNYNNGNLADGEYVSYLENGQIEKKETFRDGEIISTGNYEDGKLSEVTKQSIDFYPNGRKKSKGYLKNGKKDGFWTNWYEIGRKKSEGYYKEGIKEGKWDSWLEDGKREFEGNYKNGKKDGHGIMDNENYFYNGEWKDDKWDGHGKIISRDYHYTYKGEFKDGRMNGYGTYISKMYSYTGYFKNSHINGKGVEVYKKSSGSIVTLRGIFKSDFLFNGSMTEVFQNGQEFTEEIKNGKRLRPIRQY